MLLLFLFHEFLPFLQAVALALDVDDGAVVENAVEDRGGDGDVGEDFVHWEKMPGEDVREDRAGCASRSV